MTCIAVAKRNMSFALTDVTTGGLFVLRSAPVGSLVSRTYSLLTPKPCSGHACCLQSALSRLWRSVAYNELDPKD